MGNQRSIIAIGLGGLSKGGTARRRFTSPSFAQMLQQFIKDRVAVSEPPSLSGTGDIVVKGESHNSNSAPLRLVSSIVFSPSGVASKMDIVALVRERPEIRRLIPHYLGTIDTSHGATFEQTKEFIKGLGIQTATLEA